MNRVKSTLLVFTAVICTALVQGQWVHPAHHEQHPAGHHYEESPCALIVPGLGKSALVDRFNNINARYEADETCITYDAVNRAFEAAKNTMKLPNTKSHTLTDSDIDHLANVIIETTRIISIQYGLPRDVIYNGLPLIDTTKTVIDKYCPAFLKHRDCSAERFRTFNGLCNNLENPYWGASLTAFRRLLQPDYSDAISIPRLSVTGKELPTTRHISGSHHRDMGFHDHAVTVFLISWGQAIDHDMTFTADTKDRSTDSDPACCDKSPSERHAACWPIEIPENDPFYSLFRRRCMEFVRSASSLKPECKLGPRTQLNLITSVLDANWIYGTDKATSDSLRTHAGGRMVTTPVFRDYGLKDLLPRKLENPDDGCIRATPETFCFLAGDPRVNEQLVLSVTHILFMREHNRMADELAAINPHWTDERIFQEVRHIMAALVQQITYNEFLPMVLGKDLMAQYNLILNREGYFHGYNPKVDPSLPASFTAAAFRFGHSLLPATVERWSVSHKYIGAERLSKMLRQPYDLYKGGYCDQYISGLMNQVSQAMDPSMSQEVTNHLFQDSDKNWGLDLAALNMQRGRDHGIPSYNAFRGYCGLKPARHWGDLGGVFSNETLHQFSSMYASPDDLDLWTAGVSERPLHGSMVGPVFGCIIGETFRDLRIGDRYWYENPDQPSSFTLGQLETIRKVKLARIVCDNSDAIESTQVYVMVLPDPEVNPRVPCSSAVLPRIDLSQWREVPGTTKEEYAPKKAPSYNAPPTDYHRRG